MPLPSASEGAVACNRPPDGETRPDDEADRGRGGSGTRAIEAGENDDTLRPNRRRAAVATRTAAVPSVAGALVPEAPPAKNAHTTSTATAPRIGRGEARSHRA